jgi:nitroreductase
MDLHDVDYVLSTTRAVRKRLDLDRPVEPEIIADCLRLALQAPTGGNRQNWRFVVVTDPELRAGIAEYYRRAALPYLQAGLGTARTDQQRRVQSSAVFLAENIDKVPVLVVPCVIGRPADGESQAGFYGNILPAVWSFALALRSRGLGSAWTTLHLAHEREVAELLGIPEKVTQVALLPVAYTKGLEFKPAARQPVEQVTSWNWYGQNEFPG